MWTYFNYGGITTCYNLHVLMSPATLWHAGDIATRQGRVIMSPATLWRVATLRHVIRVRGMTPIASGGQDGRRLKIHPVGVYFSFWLILAGDGWRVATQQTHSHTIRRRNWFYWSALFYLPPNHHLSPPTSSVDHLDNSTGCIFQSAQPLGLGNSLSLS